MSNETGYAREFDDKKAEFLRGRTLEGWEKAAVENYVIIRNIRQAMGAFLVLLGVNALGRLILMERASYQAQTIMKTELLGFSVIGLLAVVTFFLPRWYTVLVTALAIFPLALGIFTVLMALALLATVPSLVRANKSLFLTPGLYGEFKSRFAAILAGGASRAWTTIGKIGRFDLKVLFFENAALFVSGKNPLNVLSRSDAAHSEFEKNAKGGYRIIRWVINGKPHKARLPINDEGYAALRQWIDGAPRASAEQQKDVDSLSQNPMVLCPKCDTPILPRPDRTCPSCGSHLGEIA